MTSIAPIFIFGSGRSGTTLLFDLLRRHPDAAWVSRLTDRIPAVPQLSYLSRFTPLQQSRLFQPSPDAINMYRHCGITVERLIAKGASLTERDVTEPMARRLRHIVASHVHWMGKRRFVNKSTMNTMRVRLMHAIFPDARFVHIIRNGYAVASSLVRVDWWSDTDIWWMGTTPREWEAGGGDPHELAAMNWKRQVEEILTNKSAIPDSQFFECRYEELLADPRALIRRIAEFCALEWNTRFERALDGVSVVSGNQDKWKSQLQPEAVRAITGAAGDLIERLGYERIT